MPKAEEIKVLNIDGETYAVDAMSDAVQAMVTVFNDWAQDEVDARSRLQQVQAAKNDLSRQIILQVRQEQEEAAAAEAGDEAPAEASVDGE